VRISAVNDVQDIVTLEFHSMHPIKAFSAIVATVILTMTLGCASTRTHEGTGQYVDDAAITTKVKTAILGEPGLKVREINVETFKGVVQLSGFVSSRKDIASAVSLTRRTAGLTLTEARAGGPDLNPRSGTAQSPSRSTPGPCPAYRAAS